MEILYDLEQGSDAWLAARLGIVTMSELDCLLVNGKGEAGFGVQAFTYMDKLIGEQITGEAAETPFQTVATARGHRLEVEAGDIYSERYEVDLTAAGIILNHGVGYSPDAMVGSDGLIEIKTKLPKFQVGVIVAGEIPKEHVPQCQGGLWTSEREWIDFISYWPGLPMFVKRAYRDEVMIRKIAERVKTFHEIMHERLNKVIDYAA